MFDLEVFSKFFSQPDVQNYVPRFLNIILDAVELSYKGGNVYWYKDGKEKLRQLPEPIHSKFLGDGGLYIWDLNAFADEDLISFANRLWSLKTNFNIVTKLAAEEVPIMEIPKRIRFGISAGSVYKLTYERSNKEEFIGYSINLASRLQSYCREVGFIVSGRVNLKTKVLDKHTYKRVIANNIKGFPEEIVIVDKTDYDKLDKGTRTSIFKEI
jgi:hypothetical protein